MERKLTRQMSPSKETCTIDEELKKSRQWLWPLELRPWIQDTRLESTLDLIALSRRREV